MTWTQAFVILSSPVLWLLLLLDLHRQEMTSAYAWLQKDDSPLKDTKYLHPWHCSGPEVSAPLWGTGILVSSVLPWEPSTKLPASSPVVTSASTTDGSSRNYRTMAATDTPEGNSSLVARDERARPRAPTVTQLASPTLQGKSGPEMLWQSHAGKFAQCLPHHVWPEPLLLIIHFHEQ